VNGPAWLRELGGSTFVRIVVVLAVAILVGCVVLSNMFEHTVLTE
jgi:hypothetical protein